ncbi:rhodopsin [Betta splendens]|uniref:Rhodopsin n=1 Tax=Betta splendens TaxID=158456 RepID=A0A6P7NYY9_BETSP|nr:rhodopsin [Betta splendens]
MDAVSMIESLIRACMCLAGIMGNNLLAIRSLPRLKAGIHTSEVLFINLAVSNLLTNLLVDLPDTIADFAQQWILGETYCGLFYFFADLSETSSIYTTFFISIYWHRKLVGSLRSGGAPVLLDSLRLVGWLLAGSWAVAGVFGIPHCFFVTVLVANGSYECVKLFPDALAMKTYEIFYLTLANVIPVAGIVVASSQIVVTLLRHQRRIRGHQCDPTKQKKGPNRGQSGHCPALNVATDTEPKPGQTSAGPGPGSQVRAAKSVVAVAGVFLVCWMTHLLLRISSNVHTSSTVVEVASYVAASYTSIIPYIFLHGVKKLSCPCRC